MSSSSGESPYLANLLDSSLDELTIPALEPERGRPFAPLSTKRRLHGQTTAPTRKAPSALLPWDGTIRWSVQGPTVFDDADEELDALRHRPGFQTQRSSDLWIFQYGLRYIPSAGDGNLYRSVKVEGLPVSTTMAQVLAKVHGDIYSACLSDTRTITGSLTAIVIFVSQRDALEFVYSNISGLRVGSTVAKSSLVHTPTYPLSNEMRSLILKDSRTRCVCVSQISKRQVELLNKALDRSVCRQYVESHEEVPGEVRIRFHSIKMASVAYTLLTRHPYLSSCDINFYKVSVRSV